MTTSHMHHLRTVLGAAGLLLLAACGKDSIVQPPFGRGCEVGELRPGQTVTGVLDAASCQVPHNWYSFEQTPYEGYRVELEKGKGYWFHMQQAPDAQGRNGVDALLSLFGRDANGASIPLAVSDDEAEGANGHDSEFYFIAPQSGTFQLVAAGYNGSSVGGYRLTMARCPVIAVLDTIGTYEDLEYEPSDCVRHDLGNVGVTSRLVLIGVPAEGSDRVQLHVTSDDVTPRFEVGGPLFDVYRSIYEQSAFATSFGIPASATLDMHGLGGTLTLAVGAEQLDPAGRFTVHLSRGQVGLAAVREGGWPMLTRLPTLGRTKRR